MRPLTTEERKKADNLNKNFYQIIENKKTESLEEQINNISKIIEKLNAMKDKGQPFVPRSYKALQRNTFFTLLSISLLAECLYFIFQEDTSEKGLSPFFTPSIMWLCTTIAYIAATGDWDANLWTISPRDDADEYILTSTTQSYTPITLALIRLYYLMGCISFPIGAAGGWLGMDKYSSKIDDNASYLTTNSIFFALLVAVGTIYYVAWCKPLADKTFAGIDEYQRARRHDYSLSRYSEVGMEGTSVTVYRSLGFGAIAGFIPEGFRYSLEKSEKKALFSVGLVSTFIVTLLTRPVKITSAWLNPLYAYIGRGENDEYSNEYALAEKQLDSYNYVFNLKNLMSIAVAAGLAGFVLCSFQNPTSIPVIIGAVISALLPIIITLSALRDLEILKIAANMIGENELKRRRNFAKTEHELTGYEKRYDLALTGFNALAATYAEDKNITRRANASSFLGRVARGSSFLYFTEDLSLINIVLNKMQQYFVALIFAPHNLLNEFVAFRGGMVHYLTQKYAQAYVYCSLANDAIMFLRVSGFRCFYYGKADFTPYELIHALELKRNELLKQVNKEPESITTMKLRDNDQPKLSTFTESVCGATQYFASFFACNQKTIDGATERLLEGSDSEITTPTSTGTEVTNNII